MIYKNWMLVISHYEQMTWKYVYGQLPTHENWFGSVASLGLGGRLRADRWNWDVATLQNSTSPVSMCFKILFPDGKLNKNPSFIDPSFHEQYY